MKEDKLYAEKNGMDVTKILLYKKTLAKFTSIISKVVRNFYSFWIELNLLDPNIIRLISIGKEISNLSKRIEHIYQLLQKLNPNNFKTMELYGNLLQNILGDTVKGEKTLEAAFMLRKKLKIAKNVKLSLLKEF